MMAFVYVFDKMHWRHKYGWLGVNLMTQAESHRLLRILVTVQNGGDQD